jgi:hypothetical protein
VYDSVDQQALRIEENVPLLALDLLSRVVTGGSIETPFFSTFHALAVDHRCRGARVPGSRLAAVHVEFMMDAIERAIPAPQIEVIVQRRARRQVFRDRPPLAAGRQNVHEAVHDLAHDHRALVFAPLAWPDQAFD